MNLRKISNQELLSKLDQMVHSERQMMHIILWHILEVDERRLYAELGYDSLYKYLTSRLGYSENAAYERMRAARVLNRVPEIAEKLEEGSLNLTQVAQVGKAIKDEKMRGKTVTQEQAKNLLEQIANKTGYETKKIIEEELDQPIKQDTNIKPQKNKTVRIELTLTEEQFQILKTAQSYVSHSVPNMGWPEILTFFAQKIIRKKEGKPATQSFAETRKTEQIPLQ